MPKGLKHSLEALYTRVEKLEGGGGEPGKPAEKVNPIPAGADAAAIVAGFNALLIALTNAGMMKA